MVRLHLNTQFDVIAVQQWKENQLNVLPNTDESQGKETKMAEFISRKEFKVSTF